MSDSDRGEGRFEGDPHDDGPMGSETGDRRPDGALDATEADDADPDAAADDTNGDGEWRFSVDEVGPDAQPRAPEREPLEPERPSLENVAFVLVGIVGTVLLLLSAF